MSENKENTQNKDQFEADKHHGRGFLALIQSTLAAIFGVQSDKNREEDFKQGDASQFIAMGIIAVVVIVVVMILVVRSVLESAGQ